MVLASIGFSAHVFFRQGAMFDRQISNIIELHVVNLLFAPVVLSIIAT